MEGRASGSTASWLTLLQSHPLPSNRGPVSHSGPLTFARLSYHHFFPNQVTVLAGSRGKLQNIISSTPGTPLFFLVPLQSVKYPGNGNFHLLQADGRKLKFRIPGRLGGLSLVHTDWRCPVLFRSPDDFPELSSPLLSCPFVLCIAAGQDMRVDTTQPGKGNTKLLSEECSPEGIATPARPPDLPYSDHSQVQRPRHRTPELRPGLVSTRSSARRSKP